jgi:hypothetical protein
MVERINLSLLEHEELHFSMKKKQLLNSNEDCSNKVHLGIIPYSSRWISLWTGVSLILCIANQHHFFSQHFDREKRVNFGLKQALHNYLSQNYFDLILLRNLFNFDLFGIFSFNKIRQPFTFFKRGNCDFSNRYFWLTILTNEGSL